MGKAIRKQYSVPSNWTECYKLPLHTDDEYCMYAWDADGHTALNFYNSLCDETVDFISGEKERINHIIDIINGECPTDYEAKWTVGDDVTTLVIGYNKGQKQEINIGKVNNQNTVMIPLYKLRQKLQYQCELHGIKYCPQEESYTSKASALDNDNIPNYGDTDIPVFSGSRIHRGLYRSSKGRVLNADINGSINILKKYFKERKSNGITPNDVRVLVNAPCQRLNAFAQAHRL